MSPDAESADTGHQDDLIIYEVVERHIAMITINRPDKRNAFSSTPDMHAMLFEALAEGQMDDDIKVIIIRGAGDHFCAGEDVRRTPVESFGLDRTKRLPQSIRVKRLVEHERQFNDALLHSDKTLITACHGASVGLGFRLALSCDLVVASDDAFFGRPQSRIGLAGFDLILPILLLRVGINRGYEALITGRTIPVAELAEIGFVSSVVPRESLMDEALRYARAVAAHSTDGLMIGRQAMKMFWSMMDLPAWFNFVHVGHPLFTNLVWRDDEANLLKERKEADSASEALRRVYRRWTELGFE